MLSFGATHSRQLNMVGNEFSNFIRGDFLVSPRLFGFRNHIAESYNMKILNTC